MNSSITLFPLPFLFISATFRIKGVYKSLEYTAVRRTQPISVDPNFVKCPCQFLTMVTMVNNNYIEQMAEQTILTYIIVPDTVDFVVVGQAAFHNVDAVPVTRLHLNERVLFSYLVDIQLQTRTSNVDYSLFWFLVSKLLVS